MSGNDRLKRIAGSVSPRAKDERFTPKAPSPNTIAKLISEFAFEYLNLQDLPLDEKYDREETALIEHYAQTINQMFLDYGATLVGEGQAPRTPQEHLLHAGKGTQTACTCGKSFATTELANQHQAWHLNLSARGSGERSVSAHPKDQTLRGEA